MALRERRDQFSKTMATMRAVFLNPLGSKAPSLPNFHSPKIPGALHLPVPDFIYAFGTGSRPEHSCSDQPAKLSNMGGWARPAILDIAGGPGVLHSAGAACAKNLITSTRKTSYSLPSKGGCNAVASTCGVLMARSLAVRSQNSPFIMKLNHNELLTTQ